ncbi:unnamed protein product [Rotaria magnacalcarata]|uniref:TIR domain-containing protein n=1 Tax=Rotaria magnacalcarata TaxID=392030 RepID=A0A8S2N522_9BILA|nr:unnamed protein product [Rotaria magnacalcarata]
MEHDFTRVINSLSESPLPDDIFSQIKCYLQQQTNDVLPSFISQSFQSLFTLEHWAWKLLSQDFHKFINQSHYLELFHSLGQLNFRLVFKRDQIEANIKSSLLIPENIQWIDQMFDQFDKIEDQNDPFFTIISLWLDNISYLIHEHTQFENLPIIIHLCERIGKDFILSNQYKTYLTQLCQIEISQSIFTTKQLFYIRTCSFMFRMYICSIVDKSPFQGEELLHRYGDDYLQMISIHSYTVNSWSQELLICIAHLIDFICACCWWGTEKAMYIKNLVASEQIVYDHIQGLIRIVDEVICKQIYEELVKSGYRVWIDYDQIHGNVMDAMAQAIERSNIIIVCMSEQYRRSNYCRAEAHYAFQRQLKIVPILLQEHYTPDGWLLFLIGQLLYVDFTKYEFPRAIELLIQELKAPGIEENRVASVQSKRDKNLVASLSPKVVTLPESILDWSQEDVQNWLVGFNLRQMAQLLVDFDGPSLNSLSEFITKSDPQEILTLFQDDCSRNINENVSLLELARFRTLLNERQLATGANRLMKKTSSIMNLLRHCRMM